MKLIQIASPEGAVSLLNIEQIKSVTPFADGSGCNIQMIGEPADFYRQVGIAYEQVMRALESAGVSLVTPSGD